MVKCVSYVCFVFNLNPVLLIVKHEKGSMLICSIIIDHPIYSFSVGGHGVLANRLSDQSCTRGTIHNQIRLISPV